MIANHDPVLSALDMEAGGVLPPAADTFYVFDEAHSLSAKVVEHFSARHALRGAKEWVQGATEAVRDAGQFAKDHVPDAMNIEWRQVFAQRAKLPRDKTILVYCNTSSFAAQVAMGLRMDGFENVRLLYGGYNEWKARGGLQAYARASEKG